MKILIACVVSCVFLLVLMAGCTSQPVLKPATPVTTAVPATINPAPSSALAPDPSIVGTWYLKMMAEQGGPALVDMMSPRKRSLF